MLPRMHSILLCSLSLFLSLLSSLSQSFLVSETVEDFPLRTESVSDEVWRELVGTITKRDEKKKERERERERRGEDLFKQ